MTNEFLLRENIFGLLGLENLPEEKKQAMLTQMLSLVQNKIFLRVFDLLTDDQKTEMASLGDEPEKVLAYMAETVPGFRDIVNEEIIKVKQDLLETADVPAE